MLEYTMKKHFNASDLFRLIQEKTGRDYKGEFNEIYCPPQTGSVNFWIPDCTSEFDELEECEKAVAFALFAEGCVDGENVCLDFDY